MLYSMQDLQEILGRNAQEKGFWEAHENLPTEAAAIFAKLALIGEELGEAVTAFRELDFENPDGIRGQIQAETMSYTRGMHGPDKPEGFCSEVADIVIRCLDLAAYCGFSLESVIALKHEYNTTRPHMHGKNT